MVPVIDPDLMKTILQFFSCSTGDIFRCDLTLVRLPISKCKRSSRSLIITTLTRDNLFDALYHSHAFEKCAD